MSKSYLLACACALALPFPRHPVQAAASEYRFELAGQASLSAGKDTVRVRLVHIPDGKPVPGAVVFESTADMRPSGMATMPGPVKPMPAADGIYAFEIEPGMAGKWALHLAAKVQGEAETVRGTVEADLVK